MARSFTKPNDKWLKEQVESEEYNSKSELVNDLIRQAREQQREVDWIRTKLLRAEANLKAKGYVEKSADTILSDIKGKSREQWPPINFRPTQKMTFIEFGCMALKNSV